MAAIVVGGASGMGRATAARLVDLGAKVAVLDLPASDGAAVAKEIGGESVFHPCDVMDAGGTELALQRAVDDLGALHIAVNTAGGGISKRTLTKIGPHPLDAFRSVIELNLLSTFNLNRLQAWHMSRNEPRHDERGVIVNTASIAAFEGQIGQVAYA
nr:SDR family NAD(P)-dependent oxidoreductase [Micromonospora sp. DSM 115978]